MRFAQDAEQIDTIVMLVIALLQFTGHSAPVIFKLGLLTRRSSISQRDILGVGRTNPFLP
jgi:hypothetical protein